MKQMIDSFILNGYSKFRNESEQFFKIFDACIHKTLKSENVDGPLETLHERVPIADLNPLRIKIFNNLNSLHNWESQFGGLAAEVLEKILGPDLAIQTKLNLSIQFPNDATSLQPLHTDRATGHSLFELVLWVSFTKSDSTGSMFLLDVATTLDALFVLPRYETKCFSEFEKIYENRRNFIEVNPGDCLLFSSNLYHGNAVNETSKTRISINCRFKNLWSPEQNDRPNERVTGSFYKPYKLSPCTKFNTNFIGRDPIFGKQ
jgi:sporadic carbohydrate cluster 2OG-Fe(II) oxygenase